jgi:hypothetical protein
MSVAATNDIPTTRICLNTALYLYRVNKKPISYYSRYFYFICFDGVQRLRLCFTVRLIALIAKRE